MSHEQGIGQPPVSSPEELSRWQRFGHLAGTTLLITTPFAAGLVAIEYAPPAHVEIAGQPVRVKPVIGQNTTRIGDGAVLRPEHVDIPVIHKAIGLDINANWNELIPQDKTTREYLIQLSNDPEPEIARITDAAEDYLLEWGAGVAGGVAIAELIGWGIVRGGRKRLAGDSKTSETAIRNYIKPYVRGGTGLLAVLAIGVNMAAIPVYTHNDEHVVIGSPELAGTTLGDETQVNGVLGDILPYLSLLETKSTFYDTASQNLKAALAQQPELQTGSDKLLFLVADDFESVSGMARLFGESVSETNASAAFYTGDWTVLGKLFETPIIDSYIYRASGVETYAMDGLHDTADIIQTEKDRGITIAEDRTRTIQGLKFLLLNDPRISTVGNFGIGDILRDPEVDVDQFIDNAVQEIADAQPQVMILHDHKLAKLILDRLTVAGITPPALVIDGRSYDFGGPRYYNTAADTTAVEYTNGSGGGHTNTKPNLGAIKNPAAYSAFTYDTVTGEWQYSVFTVRPDASVSITPLVKLAVTDTAPPPLITADSDRDNTATKHTGTVIQHR